MDGLTNNLGSLLAVGARDIPKRTKEKKIVLKRLAGWNKV
jgi:hypothetical protein